jgi:hypothetical protein
MRNERVNEELQLKVVRGTPRYEFRAQGPVQVAPIRQTVLGFPGARRLHDRPGEQTDEVVLDAPLAEIDDVAEERFRMRPEAG